MIVAKNTIPKTVSTSNSAYQPKMVVVENGIDLLVAEYQVFVSKFPCHMQMIEWITEGVTTQKTKTLKQPIPLHFVINRHFLSTFWYISNSGVFATEKESRKRENKTFNEYFLFIQFLTFVDYVIQFINQIFHFVFVRHDACIWSRTTQTTWYKISFYIVWTLVLVRYICYIVWYLVMIRKPSLRLEIEINSWNFCKCKLQRQ